MTDVFLTLEMVTTFESQPVRHWEAELTALPCPITLPKVCRPMLVEAVEGPVMVKVLKSSRIWQMLVLHLQTVAAQLPAVTVDESK